VLFVLSFNLSAESASPPRLLLPFPSPPWLLFLPAPVFPAQLALSASPASSLSFYAARSSVLGLPALSPLIGFICLMLIAGAIREKRGAVVIRAP